MEEKMKKDFDAVEWVRSVRDANFKRLGHLPPDEYFKKLDEEGRNSSLAKELDEIQRRKKDRSA
jgi:hypothetical protein